MKKLTLTLLIFNGLIFFDSNACQKEEENYIELSNFKSDFSKELAEDIGSFLIDNKIDISKMMDKDKEIIVDFIITNENFKNLFKKSDEKKHRLFAQKILSKYYILMCRSRLESKKS